ncbi:NAD(P)/FAD-dependent oxidoreductase [Novosphingobium sp. PASSN1]|uniref:flavin-containing monooxygenase n=1 Tax=Novosphingobium sp. PASSN1 TaxID=2015561 RepID=UPI000BDB2FC4|nr:NAD(P)/FAD-dependent oxidoreductase [Novosphingobium sp. PASSN1]OYU34714.1 MAG: monooxygenase [Novosphingobium sp. PASSN1]
MDGLESQFDFDPEVLLKRYREEREKRLREDGTAQFVKMEGQFARYLEDPYVTRTERASIEEELDVVILGGGFGGLLAGARLAEAGVHDVRIIEKGGDFGGTWYWNRYPGAACDVESYVYLPLLEETGYMPTEKYARAPEIFEHAKRIGRHFSLYDKALFQTLITEARWHEDRARWLISTDRGDRLWARNFVMASGPLQTPKLPGIPGIETFKGHSFHTSRWDYAYTGGNSLGGLDKLKDKNIAVIGTGATAVQCVPHLGKAANKLFVFQRTPSSIYYRNDHPTDQAWAASLTPGWQKRRMDNYTAVVSGIPCPEDLVNDGWTKTTHRIMSQATADTPPEKLGWMMWMADFAYMEEVRHRIDSVVTNKVTAEALKPWYSRLCKRPCFHDDYLATFNLPNVHLVDTAGLGVGRITEDSIVVGDETYPIDCIVYATGFELAAFNNDAVMPVIGRGGVTLGQKWKDGATTLHGIHVHKFPNYFILSTTQTAWGPNFPHMMNEQAIQIAYVVAEAKQRRLKSVEVTQEAESKWVEFHEQSAGPVIKMWAECTPSFWNDEGKPSAKLVRNGQFGGGVFGLTSVFEQWRQDGRLADLICESEEA